MKLRIQSLGGEHGGAELQARSGWQPGVTLGSYPRPPENLHTSCSYAPAGASPSHLTPALEAELLSPRVELGPGKGKGHGKDLEGTWHSCGR